MRGANLGREAVLGERADDPAGAIIGIGRVGQMLELAPAAFGKVTAWRHLVARPLDQRPIVGDDVARHGEGAVLPAGADPVAARRDANDRIAHRSASVGGSAATRSSAIIPGPGALGGAAVEPNRGAGGFERRHARARGMRR